jgi:hypothetical protein
VADASIGKAAAVAVPPVGVDHRRNSSIDLDRALYKFLYKAKYGMQVIDSKREGVAPQVGLEPTTLRLTAVGAPFAKALKIRICHRNSKV